MLPNLPKMALYDFAILKLSSPIRNFLPCLPNGKNDLYVGKNATTSGWGMTNFETKENSQVLKAFSLTVITNMQCLKSILEYYGIKFSFHQQKSPTIEPDSYMFIMCADDQLTTSRACFGDSGGN